ncbi:MAG: peptide chain release factor 1 [Chitinophagales bacterium]|nr:peptide chain release factor 1 [Chitinophagales bacterium]
MLDKLEQIKARWIEVQERLSDPEIVADQKRFSQFSKEYKDLGGIVQVYDIYKNVVDNIASNKEILRTEKDEDFREMAKQDLDELSRKKEELEEEIRILLIPKDPEDEKNVMLEIRAGTGGDEASIFAGDLYRMYTRYIETKGWKYELINENPGTAGGFKEIVVNVLGDGVYGILKYESGVHRVQRVPATESQGRVHTSAASVAVLPEADEVDVDLNEKDIKVDTFRSSGAGGQHVNKTESAVRLTHLPTGVVVECQEGRSQLKNREIAMKALRTKLYEAKLEAHNAEIAARRKTLVSTGDRSAKIRTYNFPQGRCTDHRIGLTLYNLADVMNGDLEPLIHALQVAENAEKLKEGGLA